MDIFVDALLSEKTDKIPDEFDWFAPLCFPMPEAPEPSEKLHC